MPNHSYEKITAFYATNKRMPSYSEMMELFGFKSKNAVYRLVQKFIDAGYVAKDSLGRLIPTNLLDEIPLVGSVKAGLPAATEMVDETINLNELLIRKRGDTYLVKVDGDSMIDAHIADGDLVIAERTNIARAGDIVIALVDGESTMKYLRYDKQGRPWLEAAHENYGPIYPEFSFEITAIVRGVVRKY